MSKIAIVCGLLLITVGLAGYLMPASVITDGPDGETVETVRSWTALIPAIVGIPILICGFWALLVPTANKTAMHIAVTFGLVGALAATGRIIVSLLKLINANGEFNQRAFMFLVLMGILCWMFVIFCVLSFLKAKKAQSIA